MDICPVCQLRIDHTSTGVFHDERLDTHGNAVGDIFSHRRHGDIDAIRDLLRSLPLSTSTGIDPTRS